MNIVLTTLNARYTHSSLALRYLYANLKEYQEHAEIQEYTINDNIHEIMEKIVKSAPSILCIGVYIWNSTEVSNLVTLIKKILPELIIILGGPEVSHSPIRGNFNAADYIIQGEGDIALYELIGDINNGLTYDKLIKSERIINLESICLPYDYYTDHDIQNRVIYVEASRGCPFTCEFCLSSIDKAVRYFNHADFINALERLWERGARNFKFIDRTFNINANKACEILDFFLNKNDNYLVHFEVIPENFPKRIKDKIQHFKPGTIQLEVGIQTLKESVAKRINRSMNMEKIESNLHYLQNETHAHLHVDLIIGLPGETLDDFRDNLNLLCSLTDCEIQLGILKKLSGTTISRHDIEYSMIYSDYPPYELLSNVDISYLELQEMKRFARYWDMTFNSGNFNSAVKMLWPDGDVFNGFLRFTRWIYKTSLSTYQISLNRLAEYLYTFLIEQGCEMELVKKTIKTDLQTIPGRKIPMFLRDDVSSKTKKKDKSQNFGKRQKRFISSE